MSHPQDPLDVFELWFKQAQDHPDIVEANAVNLATADEAGKPSSRMVLLKDYDADGFVFYTNLESRKGKQLEANPHAALCFYWEALSKQVRIEGVVSPVSVEEADAYFSSRPLQSRIGAWASRQSQELESPSRLVKEVAKMTARFALGDVERPKHWSGFRLSPTLMEFWERGEYRLHNRICYSCDVTGKWTSKLLYP